MSYFSVSTDITIKFDVQTMWYHNTLKTDFEGDGVMSLGDQSPTTLALPLGGSQFLPGGRAPNRYQWVVQPTVDAGGLNLNWLVVPVIGEGAVGVEAASSLVTAVNGVMNNPYSHFQFGNNTGTNRIPDCKTNQETTIANEINRILTNPLKACS